MDLTKLFETQKVLDARIEKEHPNIDGGNRLDKKILALLVELGECANEWRGFKFWSNDQNPRGYRSRTEDGVLVSASNPLLEEYVDCLHFILSIGLEYEFNNRDFPHLHEGNFKIYTERNTLGQFNKTFIAINEFTTLEDLDAYEEVFLYFICLGQLLGFTWEQIETAYYSKNAINHTRQDTGY